VGAIALAEAIPSYRLVCAMLTLLGFAGGFFAVPLNALIQQRPDEKEKGQVIATANLLTTIGVMVASAVLWVLGSYFRLSPERIIFLSGIATFVSSVYVLALVPEYFVRFSLWLLTHTIYRIRIVGQDHVPFRGPALLVSNHLSHVDGFLIGASVQRFVRFMVWRPFFEMPLFNPMLRFMHAIPVSASRHDVVASLDKARAELQAGHIVCIFAEGAISRTGNMLPFKRGFERIVSGLDVPVIPVNLDRVWGSIFSFKRGRFFWKRPERIPYPVTVTFGPPLPSSSKAADVRQAVMALASDAMTSRIDRGDLLHLRFMRTAKHRWSTLAMADAGGTELTFGRVLVASMMMSRWIRKNAGSESMVGLMLPSSIGGALANIAALLAGRVPVNLNFTAGPESVAAAIEQCGIKTILTSKQFLAKANLPQLPGMVYLEDVMRTFSAAQKVRTLVIARIVPARLLRRLYAPERRSSDDMATVIFSSGSTGKPKGVMLSHRNVLANLEGMIQLFPVRTEDRIIGVLPFFHSFGFTGTLWFPMVAGFGALYVPNPMDARAVGLLAGKYGGTMLIGTPTFYTAYIRKCTPEEFKSLRYAIVGAEKLREPVARGFKEKFGLDIIEGYGCTEMAPVVSANCPDAPEGQVGLKPGTVGQPLPGVVVRVVDPDTGAPRAVNEPGLLLVKGPNLMLGYLGNPTLTAEVIRDGWYVTGDIAAVDEDGFITLTDRLSRFSKIAGEMVPHQKIEEVASSLLDDPNTAVTAVADESRGERLVMFYTKADVKPDQLWSMLNASELPKLWLPKRENIHLIDAIPVLGTGKIDLRAVKAMAAARSEPAVAEQRS
jgi:acyl-[acyl-carrier-protein]-phospholipid O-acyltransferase / long-chain-fatty-acid--[acyl-carrier-protein] ligase